MRHVLIAALLTIPFAAAVNAQTTSAGSQPGQLAPTVTTGINTTQPAPTLTPQTTLEGRGLGQHVSGMMAPEHAILHGELFGECVSELAITGEECEHHAEEQ